MQEFETERVEKLDEILKKVFKDINGRLKAVINEVSMDPVTGDFKFTGPVCEFKRSPSSEWEGKEYPEVRIAYSFLLPEMHNDKTRYSCVNVSVTPSEREINFFPLPFSVLNNIDFSEFRGKQFQGLNFEQEGIDKVVDYFSNNSNVRDYFNIHAASEFRKFLSKKMEEQFGESEKIFGSFEEMIDYLKSPKFNKEAYERAMLQYNAFRAAKANLIKMGYLFLKHAKITKGDEARMDLGLDIFSRVLRVEYKVLPEHFTQDGWAEKSLIRDMQELEQRYYATKGLPRIKKKF
ncbi:hypothetical protein KY325_00775 [Candidatus Woesearchaeota archaeon]|nr:hypothetical protein [Candidatus Woesearchaeota archaeon]MBW3017673.1 hypothetical protein [Candidatus Woesearchaeota archaeon]